MKAFPFFIPEKERQKGFLNLEKGTAGVGDGRSARHSVLSGRLVGLPQRFLELLHGLLLMPLSFKTV